LGLGADLVGDCGDDLLGAAPPHHEAAVHRVVEGAQRGEQVVAPRGGRVDEPRVEHEQR
jgi:hypothetical protein